MTMNRITRNKAAEILGVTPQTISNYVKEGLLGSYKDEKGNFYVNGDDVERYAKKYKFIAVSEKMLDDKLAALKAEREKANDELAALRRKMTGCGRNYPSLEPDYVGMIDTLYKVAFVPNLGERDCKLLTSFIKGEKIGKLSDEYRLTFERIRQIIAKACRKFHLQAEEICNNTRSNEELKLKVVLLEQSLEILQAQYNDYRVAHEDLALGATPPLKILQTKIRDCSFSPRVISRLQYGAGVFTVCDLLTEFTSLQQLVKKTRYLGRKGFAEIDDFLDAHGLSFKEENESDMHFYQRLNTNIKK